MSWEGARGGREVPRARRGQVLEVSRIFSRFSVGRKKGGMWRCNAGMIGRGVELPQVQVVGRRLGRHGAGVPRGGGEVFSVPSREGVGR